MGIRIHKMLGYGLTDVQIKGECKINDPRINAEVLADMWEKFDGKDALVRYEKFLADKRSQNDQRYMGLMDSWYLRDVIQKEDKLRSSIDSCFVHQSEFGLKNVLCIRPLGCHDWTRYDDIMDWTEATYLSDEPQINYVKVLEHGIYPFQGYMDKRTGERLKDMEWWVRCRDDYEKEGLMGDLDRLAQAGGFSGHDEAKENVIPTIPEEVQLLAEFAGIFTSPDVYLQLRPMLYVWWG